MPASFRNTHSAFEIRRSPFLPRLNLIVPVSLVAFSCAMAVCSSGFFELDELTHFMKSQDAWTNWRGLLDLWGRPLCTGLYALGAPFGLEASRLLAVAVSALTALGTVRLARSFLEMLPAEPKHSAALLWILLFAQPMFLLQSFAVMSEMLLACVWVWSMVALTNRRPFLASLLIGLGGLARPEGWAAIICWPLVLFLAGECRRQESDGRGQEADGRRQDAGRRKQTAGGRRQEAGYGWQVPECGLVSESENQRPDRIKAPSHPSFSFSHPSAAWRSPSPDKQLSPADCLLPAASCRLPPAVCLLGLLVAIAPTVAWWLAGWYVYQSALWFVARWPWALRSPYGATAGHFALSIFIATALWMASAVFSGVRFLWTNRLRCRHVSRVTLLVVAPLFGFVALHGVLGLFGLFGSLSLPRYYVAVSPFLAIMTWFGVQQWRQRVPQKEGISRWFWTGIAFLAMAPGAVFVLAGQLPIPRNTQFRRLDNAVQWIEDQQQRANAGRIARQLTNEDPPDSQPVFFFQSQPDQRTPYISMLPNEIVAAHPYIYYRLGIPLDCSGHRRAFDSAALRDADLGTVVVVENVIWQFDGFASTQSLASCGYRKAWSSATRASAASSWIEMFLGSHLRSLIGDTTQVEVWIKVQ